MQIVSCHLISHHIIVFTTYCISYDSRSHSHSYSIFLIYLFIDEDQLFSFLFFVFIDTRSFFSFERNSFFFILVFSMQYKELKKEFVLSFVITLYVHSSTFLDCASYLYISISITNVKATNIDHS